jgi:UDP-glucose:glycoprotein glucosyltransferase
VSVFAVVYPEGRLLLDPRVLQSYDWTSVGITTSSEDSMDGVVPLDDYLLPGEEPRSYPANTTTASSAQGFAVLYGDLGSRAWSRLYQKLLILEVPMIVRHLGAVTFEQGEEASRATATTLQGYGVRLDIRNVEYKVFDDRRDKLQDGETATGLLNLTAQPETEAGDFLAGVDLEKLGLADNVDLKLALWQQHENQQSQSQKVPPVWQRRQLPLQAATALTRSADPLALLEEVSQNLPSLASLLVHVKIPPELQAAAQVLEDDRSLVPGRLYVNGRPISLEAPSFNVFEVLNLVRQEEAALRKLETALGSYLDTAALQLVQHAWIQGEEFEAMPASNQDDVMTGGDDKAVRIDVGRGWKNAIIYLNDVEKDPQYARWPSSVRSMLQSMQFGMPPMVRRNMFTVLAVIDPLDEPGKEVFQLAMQLIQNSYPARAGVLWVNQDDIDVCRTWLLTQESLEDTEGCPVEPTLGKRLADKELKETKATTQAVHRLLVQVVEEYDHEPQIALAFGEYLMAALEDHIQAVGDVSMFDLIDLYARMMEGMGITDAASAEETAREALLQPTNTYGNALRFAAERNLRPGMGFLNGRPLDGTDTSAISKAFGEEQQHVFGLIMKNTITDTAPKSVYAMLLSGDKVYKKVHPLLFGQTGESASHLMLDSGFGHKAIILASDPVDTATALFAVDIVLGYSSEYGRGVLKAFLDSMNDMPTTIDVADGATDVVVGYRILPASKADAASPLCPILAHAAQVELDSLRSIADGFSETTTLEELLKLAKLSTGNGGVDESICSDVAYMEDKDWTQSHRIIVNGRSYELEDGQVSRDDLTLLLSMEYPRARAVYDRLRSSLSSERHMAVHAAGLTAAFLGVERSKPQGRTAVVEKVRKLESREGIDENPLRIHLEGSSLGGSELQSTIAVVLEPASDGAQRISSILLLMRDTLGLSIDLILTPAMLIDGDSKVPITSYYRFLANTNTGSLLDPVGTFSNLPTNHLLTLRMDVPESWDVQQTNAIQDTDNLRCDSIAGCSDDSHSNDNARVEAGVHLTKVEYGLNSLLIFGQCYESSGTPPNGLQLVLNPYFTEEISSGASEEVEIEADGSASFRTLGEDTNQFRYSDTLVMKNVGYWQLQANAGVWSIEIAEDSKGFSMFDFVGGTVENGRIKATKEVSSPRRKIVMNDFVNSGETLLVQRRPGLEQESLFFDTELSTSKDNLSGETINVFSLATGHLYERFLKIMMLSVTRRTSSPVKFWLFENFLSPTFKATAKAMAHRIGCEVEFVTYKWPEWLRGQSEKQRIIWGYKILFLDVLFPLDVKKIIYVDADQVVRGDLKELWDMDLKGAAYGYTPFCTSREATLGYQFWREGFWKTHLQGKPYHISALYVVDLETFRRKLVGDQLRAIYQQLSADPNSLSNLDQDLPNYAQHQVPIFSLPQEWLWCESWCSDETKATAKTIDLCNNPMHKEPKVSMAKRVISGSLFNESWVELDAEVEAYEKEYFQNLEPSE